MKKKISEKTYRHMKQLCADYESGVGSDDEQPYIEEFVVERNKFFNPKYGDNRKCKCSHIYIRHFDPFEGYEAVGCKYCGCDEFEEAVNIPIAKKVSAISWFSNLSSNDKEYLKRKYLEGVDGFVVETTSVNGVITYATELNESHILTMAKGEGIECKEFDKDWDKYIAEWEQMSK